MVITKGTLFPSHIPNLEYLICGQSILEFVFYFASHFFSPDVPANTQSRRLNVRRQLRSNMRRVVDSNTGLAFQDIQGNFAALEVCPKFFDLTCTLRNSVQYMQGLY